MSTNYVSKSGLQYFWSLLKTKLSGKQDSLSTAQMNACNSGITSAKVSTYDGYASAINGKAPSSHTHLMTQLSEPSYINGAPSRIMQAKIDYTRPDKLIFLPASQIIIEKTTDGGTTWVDAGYTDAQKEKLFDGTRSQSVYIPLLNGVKSLLCGLRITITAMKYNVPDGTAETAKYGYWNSTNVKSTERYCTLDELYFWDSANSDTIGIKVEAATGANSTNWVAQFNDVNCLMTGWSGSNFIKLPGNVFGGGTNQTTQYWNYRITLMTKGTTASKGATLSTSYTNASQSINQISGYGTSCWNAPNNMMKFDHLYGWDYQQNATFPAQVTATKFNGSLNGNATNVTGTVAIANGGTGKTNGKDAANVLLNSLETGGSTPVDADYYISQYVNGGTTTTTYHRRPMSALYAYIKGKLDSVYQAKGTYLTSHQDISGKANLSGATFTGNIQSPVVSATNYFVTPHLVGQGDLTTFYHRLDFGYQGHDVWDFYEYGGVFNFYKNQTADGTGKVLLGTINTNGWVGNVKGNVTGNCSGSAGSVAWTGVTGKPTFATVATTGSYNDLTDKPTSLGGCTTGTVTVSASSTTVTISNAACASGKLATLIPMSAAACTFGFYLSEMKAGSMKFTFLEPLGAAASFGYVIY